MVDAPDTDKQEITADELSGIRRAVQLTMVPYRYERAEAEASCYNEIEVEQDNESGSVALEYEKKYSDQSCDKIRGDEAKEELLSALKDTETLKDMDVRIVTAGNVSTVILYDRENHHATVAFDMTQTFGDIADSLSSGGTEHSIGGTVHHGFYDPLVEETDRPEDSIDNDTPNNMVGSIQSRLIELSGENYNKDLTMDAIGFCSGGARGVMTVAEMDNNDFFENNPNIKLSNVYTIGAAGYGDQTFIDKANESAEQLGANIWHVQHHNDSLSNIMTPQGPWIADEGYGQSGTHVYLVPEENGNELDVLVNPTRQEIETLHEPTSGGMAMHRPEIYEGTLRKLEAQELENNVEAPEVSAEENYVIPDRNITDNMLLGL